MYYWHVCKFNAESDKTFNTWRLQGYTSLGLFFFVLLVQAILYLSLCVFAICDITIPKSVAMPYSYSVVIISILLVVIVVLCLRRENFIEIVIKEIHLMDKNLLKKKYRLTLFTVILPVVFSPLIPLLFWCLIISLH